MAPLSLLRHPRAGKTLVGGAPTLGTLTLGDLQDLQVLEVLEVLELTEATLELTEGLCTEGWGPY